MERKETKELHFARQRELLRMEYDYEKAEFERMSESVDVRQKVARGLCWFPVRLGRSYYNSLNRFVVELVRDADDDVAHAFEYGVQVNFFYEGINGSLVYKKFPSVVSFVEGNRMVVTLPSTTALKEIDGVRTLGVVRAFDDTSYRAMFDALSVVSAARDGRLAEMADIVCGLRRPGLRDIYPVRLPWLNKSQESAVNKVLSCRDVAIVHGPPGTGKTTTLVEAVYETLRREDQVLVCAQSNMAVDWICEKLVERGVPVLRIGNPVRVSDAMLSATYERQFESSPDYPELWSLRKAVRDLAASARRRSGGERSALASRLRDLRRRIVELEVKIHVRLFDNARVVASTLVGSANPLLQGRRFSTLFIDESGQAMEAATWIAVSRADRVVFAGDHCQLPPTIKCVDAERRGLSRSMMEVLVDRCPEAVTMLNVQYRMNEAIMRFSSDWFYSGRLVADPVVRHRGILDFDSPIVWIDTSDFDFREKFVSASRGRINADEGDFFLKQLEAYVNKIGVERIEAENIDFGLISPYKAQVGYLKKQLSRSGVLRSIRRRITINTIDGFQGQERDVIFISLVRDNDGQRIGFLSDLRRMNVALTRARSKLVICGSVETMSKTPFYKKLYDYIAGINE